ncbi:A-kinase-interacting protein 1 isoform X2 [Pithys albifrons albifrons]|uniref:A-kinase-interacting protein 1 isoform X2 n=1 Tax=Pithys albifrons albifrons TaxID=3385563 RepID=UPI003A5CEC7D
MEVASVGRTAGLAREVLERARRRRRRAAGPEEDSERLSAAFDSIMKLMSQASKECEKYYSFVAAPGCKEHEMKHICKYHGRQAGERGQESMEEEVSRGMNLRKHPVGFKLASNIPDEVPKTSILKFLLASILSQQSQRTWCNRPKL